MIFEQKAIAALAPTEVLSFLKRAHPSGLWTLTAIWPNTNREVTRTFDEHRSVETAAWIRDHSGVANLYWAVNCPTRDLSRKASTEDIAAISMLHVDVDPRVREELMSERQRCLALLTDKRPAEIPAPTFIIDSGYGFQAFWLLGEPIFLNGYLKHKHAQDAKRCNRQLEFVFGGDNCSDINKLMRLPFTLNIPDEKQKRRGMSAAAMAVLVQADWDRKYPLTQFTRAPEIPPPTPSRRKLAHKRTENDW